MTSSIIHPFTYHTGERKNIPVPRDLVKRLANKCSELSKAYTITPLDVMQLTALETELRNQLAKYHIKF